MAETLAIADEGKVRADIELQPLGSINRVFDRLKRGAVAGRVVIDYATVKTIRSETGALREGVSLAAST
jgi:propanol-preferring alcohol dehydrogenase